VEKIKCYMLMETESARLYVRRYSKSPGCSVSASGVHNKIELISEDAKSVISDIFESEKRKLVSCECGYKFKDDDPAVYSIIDVYSRSDTGELVELRNADVGAMWFSDTYPWKGPDRKSLVVRTPGGDWPIDMQASNCDKKDDKTHKCWVRHGKPPEVTVDKNGNTCGAGAGSILIKGYHGFLRNGYLERC